MSSHLSREDETRRTNLESQGFSFLDRTAPHSVILTYDVPQYALDMGPSVVCTILVNKLSRAIRHGRMAPKATTIPDPRCVRLHVIYHIWDLESVAAREDPDAVMILERVTHLLRKRSAYEQVVKGLVSDWPEPEEMRALSVHWVDEGGEICLVW